MRSRRLKILKWVLLFTVSLAVHAATAVGTPPPPPPPPPSPPEELKAYSSGPVDGSDAHLKPGQAITRKIWKDTRFVFEGRAGEVVTLKVTGKTPGIDPHITLLNPLLVKEAFDDDSGGHGNSLIKNHALKRNGRYTVVVGIADSHGGDVEILFEKAEPPGH